VVLGRVGDTGFEPVTPAV